VDVRREPIEPKGLGEAKSSGWCWEEVSSLHIDFLLEKGERGIIAKLKAKLYSLSAYLVRIPVAALKCLFIDQFCW
jgi:hypothetical protein